MALLTIPISSHHDAIFSELKSRFRSSMFTSVVPHPSSIPCRKVKTPFIYSPVSCSAVKIVRDRSLDRHVVKQNQIRFVQKLKTLLLSKPKHYMPIHILSKCRAYLALSKPRSILSMIHRYPTIFKLFSIPMAPTPFNAAKSGSQLCVGLTPAASILASQESKLKTAMSAHLASKLQKLLMLSPHRRLLLSKLVHLGPDLGLPPNFRSRLCNDYPTKFKTVETSYGRALELVFWDPQLSKPLCSSNQFDSRDLIVDRPLKFKRLKLRKGLNLKRHHEAYLLKFNELPDICPYSVTVEELDKESMEAEKRACAVVREILGMTVEKRCLIDHLTHFRKDFGLSNKLRSMIIRHPELFYVSVKGQRDSVFLVEGFDDKGELLEKDDCSVIKAQLMNLVREGKKLRRLKRKGLEVNFDGSSSYAAAAALNCEHAIHGDEDYDDGFENLFDSDDSDMDVLFGDGDISESEEQLESEDGGVLWIAEEGVDGRCLESW